MDTQMLITMVIMVVLFEGFLLFLYVKYKQGKIDRNPFLTIIIKEWKIIYYAIFHWRKHNRSSPFSLHEKSMYFWLFLALLHEQIIEMFVFHIYFKKEEPSIAYIMSGLHIYSIIYIIGDYNWVRNTPVLVKDNKVVMKIGARRELMFHIEDIERIQATSIQYKQSGEMIHEQNVFHVTAFPRVLTRIFGISDELKYEIIFKSPIASTGYFGMKKKVSKALIYIHQSDNLVEYFQDNKINVEKGLKETVMVN
ncbi:hypothetical protein WAK64_00415 [Bacillus spongiae]|uniref:Uncharacterized protein n=2 Tax=Bacillus spongiae TaxID=2683610 RepID=A0ABU8H885_9BACI